MISYASLSIAAASAVLLAGILDVRSSQAQEPMLTDTVWELQQIQYNNDTLLEPESPENYTIQFFEDGTIAVQADCNFVRGTYDEAGTDFITLGPSTLAACPPDSMDDEFRMGLADAALYFFEDGNLYMDLPADAGTMMFAPAADTAATEEDTEMVEEETETIVEEEPEVIIEEKPEMEVEEDVTDDTSEMAPANEPVRGLW
jgi:heat shock protein HslJ